MGARGTRSRAVVGRAPPWWRCVELAHAPFRLASWDRDRRRLVRLSENVSYVQRVLQPGEQVLHISSIHWIVYWPGVVVALLAVVAYWLAETRLLPGLWRYTAYALALVAVVLLIRQWFRWWVTEIAVTNRRVIYKKGFIRRQTNEMNMDKVESVQIDQSILGRLLDYGDVTILGTGEGFEMLRTIASPIELRNSITGTTHKT
jgi:hypothetical protein